MGTAPTGGDSAQRVQAIYAAAARASATAAPHPLAAQLYGQPDLPAAAGAALGCADPTALAGLQPGQTVLDLGCGAGLDALLAARHVGPARRIIGVDITPEMIVLARRHAAEAAVTNAEFRLGTIEDLPVPDSSIDVVISNCAGSLSPAKDRLLAEARRILVPGGRLAIADLALRGALPASVRDWLAAWGGIAGALTVEAYHAAVTRAGFTDVAVQVLHTFGLADIEMVESTPLGSGGLSGLTEGDLRAADGIVASVHVTATRPYGPAGASHD
ncbi:MAG TPA: methyltransferase domain-containing protein [Trebonia sp.]|jgi:SAM-dependent methyltransferase